jgi:hypothetical protein
MKNKLILLVVLALMVAPLVLLKPAVSLLHGKLQKKVKVS